MTSKNVFNNKIMIIVDKSQSKKILKSVICNANGMTINVDDMFESNLTFLIYQTLNVSNLHKNCCMI